MKRFYLFLFFLKMLIYYSFFWRCVLCYAHTHTHTHTQMTQRKKKSHCGCAGPRIVPETTFKMPNRIKENKEEKEDFLILDHVETKNKTIV